MRVTVVGAGYVGLTTGASLAEIGHMVVCVDVDAEKIAALARGVVPFFEPGLTELVLQNVREGRLTFAGDAEAAVRASDVVMCAVGTPPNADGSADLSFVQAVAAMVAQHATPDAAFVMKSTVPPGTAKRLAEQIGRPVASNPEFLREGSAVADALKPDRIVIGTSGDVVRRRLEDVYRPLTSQGVLLLATDPTSAEIIKYASNAFLATKISFVNEVANYCETVGASIDDVVRGMGTDHRIGPEFLRPGVGYGGSCFPKDVRALAAAGEAMGYRFDMLPKVEEVNRKQRERWYQKVVDGLGGSVAGKRVAMWGLAFKRDTDDVREAPSLYFLERLLAEGATVCAFDPAAIENARRRFPTVEYAAAPLDAARGADALVVLTDWPMFGAIARADIRATMRGNILVDGRNILAK